MLSSFFYSNNNDSDLRCYHYTPLGRRVYVYKYSTLLTCVSVVISLYDVSSSYWSIDHLGKGISLKNVPARVVTIVPARVDRNL